MLKDLQPRRRISVQVHHARETGALERQTPGVTEGGVDAREPTTAEGERLRSQLVRLQRGGRPRRWRKKKNVERRHQRHATTLAPGLPWLGVRVFLADLLREILYNPNRALALLVFFPAVQFSRKDSHDRRSHDENPDVAFFAQFSKKKAIKELL